MAGDGELRAFTDTVWQHFTAFGRHDLPWRSPEPDGSFDPYKILVSEIMLQQTQVQRVIPKYHEFLTRFPDAETLAGAPLGDVLTAWNGLGYNRRAKFLWQAAQAVLQSHGGKFPADADALVQLPGVGKNTAGAVMAYAFNMPVPFIETNIRTVYIYHFFQNQQGVSDAELLAVIKQTIDTKDPRTWHWALMDYGTFLKQTMGNLNKLSKAYARQAPFQGSKRQIRGQVIRLLSGRPHSQAELTRAISDDRLAGVLTDLLHESMIKKRAGLYSLA